MALLADLRSSLRTLRRAPALSLALFLTIALGIGSNASVLGFIRGLVTREAHPRDRRARIVRLTAAGEQQAARIFAVHKGAMDLAASGLSKTERAALIGLLKKLGTSAGTPGAPQQLED